MRQMSNWQKSVTIPTLLLSVLTAFVPPSTAASTATTQEIQTKKITSFQNEGVYQLAQGSDNCREVAARNGLYVQEDPTVYSRAIRVIPYGRNVTVVESRGTNTVSGNPGAKWMPISAPIQGYVYAGYLSSCQESPAPKNCREVSQRGGLYVRREPSINSNIVGVVPNGRNVTIENRSANGWVPNFSAPGRLCFCR